MASILVTGAASGIGREFTSAYAKDAQVVSIYALDIAFPRSCCNNDSKIKLLEADVTSEQDVENACRFVREDLNSRGASIDVVIHSAGVRGLEPAVHIAQSSDVVKAESLETMTAATLERTLRINTIGSFIFLKALVPLLEQSAESAAKVVIISSRMGSIGYNRVGGGYAYRVSKAAQNALVRSLSIDIPQVCWLLLHPGRVETGLVPVKEEGAITSDESVQDMISLLSNLDRGRSGSFIDRFGQPIPW